VLAAAGLTDLSRYLFAEGEGGEDDLDPDFFLEDPKETPMTEENPPTEENR